MTLSHKDKWIWDFWLVSDKESDDGLFHIYFLQADNTLPHPDDRHRNVTQGHATSKDLVNWKHKGTCFAPSKTKSWDDWTTWTGSVIKDDKGLWHLFYTGTMKDLKGMHQRIGHATSKDMHSWERVGDGMILDLVGPNAEHYEEFTPGHWHVRAMRDPGVMRDPDVKGGIMYFTARVPGRKEPNAGGAIGFASSPDLKTWTLEKPVYTSGDFGQLEVPQVFKYGNKWYCMFCTAGQHWSEKYRDSFKQEPVTGSHYLTADNPRGPWTVAPGKFFDGRNPANRYSGKLIEKDGKLYTMGFVEWNADKTPALYVSDPVLVEVDDHGILTVKE